MILCSCCERRLGHSIEPCDCAPDYCHRCLACDRHCVCPDRPVIVSEPEAYPEEAKGTAWQAGLLK
jgi:hypothetical protein